MPNVLELQLQVGDIVRRGALDMKITYMNIGSEQNPHFFRCAQIIGFLPFVGPRMEILRVNLDGGVRAKYLDSFELERVELHKPNGEVEESFAYVKSILCAEVNYGPDFIGLSLLDRVQH